MRSDLELAILERLRTVMATGRLEPGGKTGTLDPGRYLSRERVEEERRTVFRDFPLIVGRESDLEGAGSYFTHEAAGVPLLLVRGKDGRARAFLNACRHRGTRLVPGPSAPEPQGCAKAFVCRYHAWTYDLEGSLGHVPLPACFPDLDKAALGLFEVPLAVRHGFLWVVPKPQPPGAAPLDVARFLGRFDDDLTSFGLESHAAFKTTRSVRAANWKLVMDAFLEGYHVKSLHAKSLSRFFIEDAVVIDTDGGHVRSVGARKTLRELAKGGPPPGFSLRAHSTVFYTLFPNTVLVFHPDSVSHIALFPKSAGEVEFVHTLLVAEKERSPDLEARYAKTHALIDGVVFQREDLEIAESIQSTLGAFPEGERIHLGELEQAIVHFHEVLDAAMHAGDAGEPPAA